MRISTASSQIFRVPLASSGLEPEDIDAVIETLQSNALTMGERVREFETLMARYLGASHFVMMNSGSSANLAIIESLLRPTDGVPRLQPGDGVLVPAIAWPTTVWPLVQLGLKPVFVDVDVESASLDLAAAERVLSAKNHGIRAVFPIHPLGRALSPAELDGFCEQHSLILISDVCEALGSWRGGVHAGLTSVAASFSFYFSHHITTMEGGGVATNDDRIADDLRSIRSHGWSRDRRDANSWPTHGNDVNSKFLFVSTGFNIRPMEIQAALGLGQIARIDTYIQARRQIASRVQRALAGTDLHLMGSSTLNDDPRSHSWMLLPIRAKTAKAAVKAVAFLEKIGVETRPILTGNFTAQPSLRRILGEELNPEHFTNANLISQQCFMVGCHHHFTEAQIVHLTEALSDAAKL